MTPEGEAAADRLERERYARPVREHRPTFAPDYVDLLAIADAELRTQDEREKDTA